MTTAAELPAAGWGVSRSRIAQRRFEHAARRQSAAEWVGIDARLLEGLALPIIDWMLDRHDELVSARRTIADHEARAALADRMIVDLYRQTREDVLTGVLNRRGIDELLEFEVRGARRTGKPLAIVVIDVEGLKRTDDELGHAAGDELLRAATTAIRSPLRAGDHVGRAGGDEFLAILPGTDAAGVERAGADMVRTAATLRITAAPDRPVAITLGWASTSEGFADPELVAAVADERLYARRALNARLGRGGEPTAPDHHTGAKCTRGPE